MGPLSDAGRPAGRDGHVPFVLVVEDSPTQAHRLRYLLERHGYEVGMAADGREALDLIAVRPPDLVLSDIVMPNMDGYALCRAIRQDPASASLPVMLLTSLFEPSDVIEGLKCGANNLLTKPYSEESLLSRIEQTLENLHLHLDQGSDLRGDVEVFFQGTHHVLRFDPAQTTDFLLSTFEDAVERNRQLRESNAQLQEAYSTIAGLEARYRSLIENSVEALVVVGRDGLIRYVNHAAGQLFGERGEDLVGRRFAFSLVLSEVQEVELESADGSQVFAELRVVETRWGEEDAFLASLRDVTENVALREELRSLSLTDELTGLHNRRGFLTLAEHELRLAWRRGEDVVLLFADMDGLKRINDQYGHQAGDDAIAETARILRSTLRDSDIVARYGGDEFVILPVFTMGTCIEIIVRRIQSALEQRNQNKETPWDLSLSVGSTWCRSADTRPLEELLAEADEAMYREKQARKVARA